MKFLGDYPANATVNFTFTTTDLTGTPTSLLGTPKVKVYADASSTESSEIDPTVDFDSRTGLNHVSIDLSGDNGFYSTAQDYSVVITAGTVDGTSVVGYTIAHFSVENRYHGVNNGGDVYALLTGADTQLTSIPSTTSSLVDKLKFVFQYFRNRRTVTDTTETLYREDASTSLGTATLSDDGTTFTKGEMS